MKETITAGITALVIVLSIGAVAIARQDPAKTDSTISRVEWLKRIESQIESVDNEITALTQRTAEMRAYRTYLEGQRQLLTGMKDSLLTISKTDKKP